MAGGFLFNQGLPLTRRHTVGDDLDALVAILRERSEQADVLIVNGGLGPTSDDLSALAAATSKGEGLILHPEWLETMTRFFAERGRPMAESNRKQAEIPASAEMINNPVGTACGFAVQLNRCLMFFTPGVPSEFKVMVEQEILPRLRQRFTLPEPPVCLRLTTFGRSESELAQSLNPLTLPPGVVMGYRSSMPIIELKLTGPADQRDAMLALWPGSPQGGWRQSDFRRHGRVTGADCALPAGAAAEPDAQRAVYRRPAGAAAVPRRRAAAGQRSGSGTGGRRWHRRLAGRPSGE